MKTELSPGELLRKPHYLSIFRLTLAFQKQENGLQQKHYRYALHKDKNVKNQLGYLNSFFLDPAGINILERMLKTGAVKKNCITGDNLKNFLALMEKKQILEVVNPGEKNKRYKVSVLFLNSQSKDWVKSEINRIPNDMVNSLEMICDISSLNLSEEKVIAGYLFGFPFKIFIEKEHEDIDLIKKHMFSICKNVIEINKIKCKYTEGGIGKVSIYVGSAIQPQLINEFRNVDKEFKKMKKKLNNLYNGFRG